MTRRLPLTPCQLRGLRVLRTRRGPSPSASPLACVNASRRATPLDVPGRAVTPWPKDLNGRPMRAWAEAVRPSWTTTATDERVPSPGGHDPVLVRPDRPLFAPCPPLRFQRGGDTSACHPDAPLVERCMHRPSKAEHRVHMLRRGQHWRLSGGEAAGGLVACTGPCRRARSGRGRCRRVGAAPSRW